MLGQRLVLLCAALWVCAPLRAEIVTLHPSKDNTIFQEYESPALYSDGAGPILYVGRIGDRGGGLIRRSLMTFDVAAALPANAVITSASLTLRVDRSGSGGGIETIVLARLLSDWGEGAGVSIGGSGGGASDADATWTHRFYGDPKSAWTNPGGDFAEIASAIGTLGDTGLFTINDPGLVPDLQTSLANPTTNFGWMIQGDEATLNSAKQIESREGAVPPALTITYAVPEPGCAVVAGLSSIACLRRHRRRNRIA